jgi:hypothetical protein
MWPDWLGLFVARDVFFGGFMSIVPMADRTIVFRQSYLKIGSDGHLPLVFFNNLPSDATEDKAQVLRSLVDDGYLVGHRHTFGNGVFSSVNEIVFKLSEPLQLL